MNGWYKTGIAKGHGGYDVHDGFCPEGTWQLGEIFDMKKENLFKCRNSRIQRDEKFYINEIFSHYG